MTCSISVFGAILVVTAVTPSIIVAIALLSIVYYRVQVRIPELMLALAECQLWLVVVVGHRADLVLCACPCPLPLPVVMCSSTVCYANHAARCYWKNS